MEVFMIRGCETIVPGCGGGVSTPKGRGGRYRLRGSPFLSTVDRSIEISGGISDLGIGPYPPQVW